MSRPRTPEQRARQRQYQRAYRARHADELRIYKREWKRAKADAAYRSRYADELKALRLRDQPVTASLHGLRCPYPDGCTCRPILVVREERWQ